jgi:hypothetical protein
MQHALYIPLPRLNRGNNFDVAQIINVMGLIIRCIICEGEILIQQRGISYGFLPNLRPKLNELLAP